MPLYQISPGGDKYCHRTWKEREITIYEADTSRALSIYVFYKSSVQFTLLTLHMANVNRALVYVR